MSKTRDQVVREILSGKEDRTDYAVEFGDSSIALQIKALRLKRGWTQEELGERAGMMQSRISALEDVEYSSWNVTTLRRIAAAFDLPLVVAFESWGKLVGDIVGLSRDALERPSLDEDPAFAEHAKGDVKENARAGAVAHLRGTPPKAEPPDNIYPIEMHGRYLFQPLRPTSEAASG